MSTPVVQKWLAENYLLVRYGNGLAHVQCPSIASLALGEI